MVQPTPWRADPGRQQPANSTSSSRGGTARRRVEAKLRAGIAKLPAGAAKFRVEVAKLRAGVQPLATLLSENVGYLCAAAASMFTFTLLFKPWLATGGPDGSVWSNAFGQTHITTTLVGLWSKHPPSHYNLSGKWAVLASIAIFLTICAAVINLRARSVTLAGLTTVSAVAVAFFIALTLIYLNSKGSELRSMIGSGPPTDLGTQAGFIIRWASGQGQYPVPGLRTVAFATARLTATALTAGAVAIFAAIAAIAQWIRSFRLRTTK